MAGAERLLPDVLAVAKLEALALQWQVRPVQLAPAARGGAHIVLVALEISRNPSGGERM